MEQKNDKTSATYAVQGPSWVDWLMEHRMTAAISCIAIVLIVGAGLWFIQTRRVKEIKDFETADLLADELEKSAPIFDETDSVKQKTESLALLQLKELVDRHPTLQTRFDSLIAEEMLLASKQNDIDPYAERAIKRMQAIGLVTFAEYSDMSRLTGVGRYKEALTKAYALKKTLNEQQKPMQANETTLASNYQLYGFLLLHIASLNQQLGNQDAMLQTMIELKEYLGLSKREVPLTAKEKELAKQMLAHLQEKQSSLLDFIEESPKAASL